MRQVAELRPLLLELDPQLTRTAYPLLEHEGMFERLRARSDLHDVQRAAHERARFQSLYRALGSQVHESELVTRLTAIHLGKAIVSASLGEHDTAMMHSELGLVVAPDDARFLKLRGALESRRAFDASSLWRQEE
jgi:hypothetical protein